MTIEILYTDDCPNRQLAEDRVREALTGLDVRAEVVLINVNDERIAKKVRFPGSPTIRVDGEDVAPSDNDGSYHLRCRVYPTSSGLAGAPDKDVIRAAIQRRAA